MCFSAFGTGLCGGHLFDHGPTIVRVLGLSFKVGLSENRGVPYFGVLIISNKHPTIYRVLY